MKRSYAYCLLILSVLWSREAASEPPDPQATPAVRWHWSKPRAGGMDLLALTYGNGLWVAVGEGGTVLTSRDALTWDEQVTDMSETLDAVVWKPGCFLATGRDSILTSRDGTHWSSSKWKLMLPAASPTRFLAFAPEGHALWSEDGVTWHSSERPKGESYRYLKWVGSSFLAGVDEDEWASTDGESWKRVEQSNPSLKRVFGLLPESQRMYDAESLDQKTKEAFGWKEFCHLAANKSHIIAVSRLGRVFRSKDGLTWEVLPTGHPYQTRAIQWADGKFVAVGEVGKIATSEDGLNWRLVTSEKQSMYWLASSDTTAVALKDLGSAVVFENGKTMTYSLPHALGTNYSSPFCHTPHGFVFYSVAFSTAFPSVVSFSKDGQQWGYTTRPTSHYSPKIIAMAGSRIVALASDGSVLLSDDGVNWREGREKAPWSLECATSHSGKIIATGSGRIGRFITTSRDGESWETSVLNLKARFKTIISNGSICLLVSEEGSVFRSADLQTWTQCTFPNGPDIAAVAWSVNQFVAAGQSGRFYSSADGLAWRLVCTNGPKRIHSMVARPGGGFIATDHFQLLESTDGRDWQRLDAPQDDGGNFIACAFNGNGFVAVGIANSATSIDGVAWQIHRIEGSPELTDVCWGENRWVATSTKHGFYYSSDGVSWTNSLTAVPAQAMRTVVWTGEEFLAGGNAGVQYASWDGRLWRQLPSRSVEAFLDMAVSDGHVLALMSGNVTLRRSLQPSGSWQVERTGLPTEMLRLNWDGNRFLAVGQDRVIYSSADGQRWTEETAAAGGTRAVASGGGWYATAGGFGTLALSQDLKQWGQQSLDDGMLLLDVCYGKGRFVALGMLGQIVHSDVISPVGSTGAKLRENNPLDISNERQGRSRK